MRKDFGPKNYLFPMPVLMIATYGDNDEVDVMNMAWGGICDSNKVALNITEGHKTSKNIKARGAFTISVADAAHVVEADYLGIVSGNKTEDKFERSGLTATKGFRVVGRIVNATAREDVLAEDGKPDVEKMNAICFDTFHNGYYTIGERVGTAFSDGKKLK